MALASLKVAIDFVVDGLEKVRDAAREMFRFQSGIQKIVIPTLKDFGVQMTKSGAYVIKGMKGFQKESTVMQSVIDKLSVEPFEKFKGAFASAEALSQMSYDLGISIEELQEKMKIAGIELKDQGEWFWKTRGTMIPYKKSLEMLRKSHKRFRMEMLSVMFFGMQLTKVFGQYVNTVLELTGVTDLFNITMQMMVLSVIDPVIEAVISLSETLMGLPEPAQKALGMFIIFGNVLGNVLFFLGAMILGLGGLASAFGTMAAVIAVPGMAAIFTLIASMLGITNDQALMLVGSLGAGVGAVLGFGKTMGETIGKISKWMEEKQVIEFVEKGLTDIWDALVKIKDKIISVTANFIDNVTVFLVAIKDKIITVWANWTSNISAWVAALPLWAQVALTTGLYIITVIVTFGIGYGVAQLVGLEAGEDFITSFGKSLETVGAGAAVGAGMGAAIGSIVPGLGTLAGVLVGGVLGAVSAAFGGATTIIQKEGSSWGEVLSGFGENIGDWWRGVTKTFSEGIDNAGQTIESGMSDMRSAVSTGFNNIKSNIDSTLSRIKSNVSIAWNNMYSHIGTILNNIRSSISTWGSNVWNSITSTWANIKLTISNVLYSIWSNITSTFSNIVGGMYNWGVNFINNLVRGIQDWGWRIADALWNLIPEPFRSAIRWGTNIIVNVVQTVTKAIVKGVGAQAGGVFTKPTLTLLAEKGPEAAIPLGKGFKNIIGSVGEMLADRPVPALTLLTKSPEISPLETMTPMSTIVYQPNISIAATITQEIDINRMMSKVDDHIVGRLKSMVS